VGGYLGRLDSRSGAHIEHCLSRLRAEDLNWELGGGLLDGVVSEDVLEGGAEGEGTPLDGVSVPEVLDLLEGGPPSAEALDEDCVVRLQGVLTLRAL
jgi:hypothetical protein